MPLRPGRAQVSPGSTVVALSLLVILLAGCGANCPKGNVDDRLTGAESMVANGELIGLEEGELVGRIGTGTRDKTFHGWDYVYYLGPDRSCVDSRWLVVRLGADWTVAMAQIRND